MGRKSKGYKRPEEIAEIYNTHWRIHYHEYIMSLAYQLFKWEGLPDSIDPRFLEMSLHNNGCVAFYKDPYIGYIVARGAPSGQLNHYNLPLEFQASSNQYNKRFRLYTYNSEQVNDKVNYGVLIRNNDISLPTSDTIYLFAEELAQLKTTARINMLTSRVPFIFKTTPTTKLSLMNIYHGIELGTPLILADKGLDLNDLHVMELNAPFLLDKLNTHRIAIWNEVMTFLGIDNANIEKRERLITEEVNANADQVGNSSNIMLKSRQDAVEVINKLYGTNIKVSLRSEIVDKFLLERSGGNGKLHNGIEGDY